MGELQIICELYGSLSALILTISFIRLFVCSGRGGGGGGRRGGARGGKK